MPHQIEIYSIVKLRFAPHKFPNRLISRIYFILANLYAVNKEKTISYAYLTSSMNLF